MLVNDLTRRSNNTSNYGSNITILKLRKFNAESLFFHKILKQKGWLKSI